MKKQLLNKSRTLRRIRHEAIAIMVFSGALLGIFIAVGGPIAIIYPQTTTLFLHYNLQYRAGNMEIEQTILNESLRSMVGMFDEHPTWKYTIELQAYAIERLLNESDQFPGILEMMQIQNKRGQLELLCGVYSSQILNAYPGDPLLISIQLAHEIMDRANLTRSRAILFQEGQYAPGLAYYLNQGDWEGVDTVLISGQETIDYWPIEQARPREDIPLFISHLGNRQHYILEYDYVPRMEAGMYHGWIHFTDAELMIEYKDTPPGEPEFTVDPQRLQNVEDHYASLELRGNRFMTCEEWVEHCLTTGHVMELGHYQPSTHWVPTKYSTCFTWYGDNSGNVDDGDMLANNYRGRNILESTLILNATYGSLLSTNNQTVVNDLLNAAKRALIKAMVTDTTGVNPNPMEREYGYANIQTVFLNCSSVVKCFLDNIPALAGIQQLQVDLATKTIKTIPTPLLIYTTTNTTLEALNNLLPIDIEITTTGTIPAVSVRNATFQGTELIQLDVQFPGTNNWSIRKDHIAVHFTGDLDQLVYCPPLVENLTVRINRTDYIGPDILNFHIPLSNGLIFVPDSKDSETGCMIIHNASQYHTAPRWISDRLSYMTGPISIPAPYQFFILPHTTIAQAQGLANRLNNQLSWTIGGNASYMQGFEYMNFYFSSIRGEQWAGGDWW